MKLLGYTFSDGTVLCARHATDVHDEGIEISQGAAIYNNDLAHSDIVCNVERCGVILEKNCTDGCGTGAYSHYLFYDDETEATFAVNWVRVEHDEEAEVFGGDSDVSIGYHYAVAFTTTYELSDEQAQELFQITAPDEYDLNVDEDDEDDEDLLDNDADDEDFPAVFTEQERSAALACAEHELTIEYIERLERVAVAALAYFAKGQSKGHYGEAETAQSLYDALSHVGFME